MNGVSVAAGIDSAPATASSRTSRAAPARSIASDDRRSGPRWGSTQKELPARAGTQQREDDVVPRVEVVRDDQQLAESRLAEVIGQQLRVAAAQIGARGLGDVRPPRSRSQRPPMK